MRKALDIALKDVKRTFRDLPALATMLAAPLVIAVVLGSAFGGDKGFSIAPTKVVVADLDTPATAAAPDSGAAAAAAPTQATEDSTANGGSVGSAVVQALTSEGLQALLVVKQVDTQKQATDQVDAGEAAVAVIVPAGLTAGLQSGDTAGEITLYRDPTKTIGPGIVNAVVQRVIARVNGAAAAGGAAAQLAVADGVTKPADIGPLASQAAQSYLQQAQARPAMAVDAREPKVSAADKTKDVGVAGPVLVGMMIFFMFLAASNVARSILDEDANGTLPRLFTTPTPRGVILAGKFTSVFLTVLIQAVVLMIAGKLFFHIDWGGLAPTTALTLVAAGVAAGFAVFLMSLARTPGQAGAISSGVFLVMALAGGNFIGTANPGGIFGTVRLITPNGWLLKAWDTTLRGGSLGDVAMPVVVVAGFALLTFLIGVAVFRRRFA